jgi:transcriptional regulator with XRE-family HTH domain
MSSMPVRVRRARTAAGFSQAELARRVGVERSAVTQWERAQGTTPSVAHLAKIAIETSVCFEWLATGRGPSSPEPGAFDAGVMLDDFVRDALESRALSALRRLGTRRKETAVRILELI